MAAMIARIWRTQVDSTRLEEYQRFAETYSLPMFRAQGGFLGVLFVGVESERAVISLWEDAEAAAALDSSPSYRETVARISAAGFLSGGSSVEVFEVHGGDLSRVRSPEIKSGQYRRRRASAE
jgi:heme-degrading monooxygenase HmoA